MKMDAENIQTCVFPELKDQLAIKPAKPFLKWVGGKQQLLSQLSVYFPKNFSGYIEPFVGGGAVFFYLWNSGKIKNRNILFDVNNDLICTYKAVRDNVEDLIELLKQHQKRHNKKYYYMIRELDRKNTTLTLVEKAARTIYLNRTCYNGLYRVNRNGQFNVPVGSYKDPKILYEGILRASSKALQNVTLKVLDFREVLSFAKKGDFLYLDPPYDPLSKTANFTSYSVNNFTDEDQKDLADVFEQLTERGCYCMLSNSYTDFILDLYKKYRIKKIQARRAVNSDGNGRGVVPEALILNY